VTSVKHRYLALLRRGRVDEGFRSVDEKKINMFSPKHLKYFYPRIQTKMRHDNVVLSKIRRYSSENTSLVICNEHSSQLADENVQYWNNHNLTNCRVNIFFRKPFTVALFKFVDLRICVLDNNML